MEEPLSASEAIISDLSGKEVLMLGILKQNRILVLTFTALLALGFWLSIGQTDSIIPAPSPIAGLSKEQVPSKTDEQLTPSDAVVSHPASIVDPWVEVVAETEPAPMNFFTLLPENKPEMEPSCCSPAITLNGNSMSDEAKPTTIRTLPPEASLTEDTKGIKFAEENEKPDKIRKPDWVPFIYFYQQSMTQFGPMKTLCICPIPSEPAIPAPMPCPTMTYQPLYPITLVPVYPVFPVMPVFPILHQGPMSVQMPAIKSSRFGASKFVYPNGVVIKPKVYYPNRKLRNVLRAVTP